MAAVLAQKMLVVQYLQQRLSFAVDRQRVAGHARHIFQNRRIVRRLGRARSPAEWTVPGHQRRRNRIGINLL